MFTGSNQNEKINEEEAKSRFHSLLPLLDKLKPNDQESYLYSLQFLIRGWMEKHMDKKDMSVRGFINWHERLVKESKALEEKITFLEDKKSEKLDKNYVSYSIGGLPLKTKTELVAANDAVKQILKLMDTPTVKPEVGAGVRVTREKKE